MPNRKKVRGFQPWFYKKVRVFCWLEDMTAQARRYGCAGLQIRLRWLEDSTALARRYDCADLKIRLRWLEEVYSQLE